MKEGRRCEDEILCLGFGPPVGFEVREVAYAKAVELVFERSADSDFLLGSRDKGVGLIALFPPATMEQCICAKEVLK
jgi:hypothetical protein